MYRTWLTLLLHIQLCFSFSHFILKKSANLHFLGVYSVLVIISACSYEVTSLQDDSHWPCLSSIQCSPFHIVSEFVCATNKVWQSKSMWLPSLGHKTLSLLPYSLRSFVLYKSTTIYGGYSGSPMEKST